MLSPVMKALNDDYVAIDHALYPSLSWSMNPDDSSSHDANTNFVLKSIAFEFMGHELFRKFHLDRHISTIKRDQCLVANIAQKLIVPYDL